MEAIMATRLIEQEDVSRACNDLIRAGEEPSTLKVRKMLGKGSHSTIQKFIKAWKESEERQAIHVDTLPATVELPPEFREGADLFIKQIFKLAEDHHAAVTEQIKQACDQTVEKSLKEVRDAVDYVETIDQENADLKDSLETLGQEKTVLLGEKSNLEKKEAALNFKLQALEEKLNQKESELAGACRDRDALQVKIEDQEGRLSAASTEIAGHKKAIELLKDNIEKQDIALGKGQDQIKSLEGDLKTTGKALDDALSANEKIRKKLKDCTINFDAEKQTTAELRGELKATSGQLKKQDDLLSEIAQLKNDLGNALAENQDLKNQIEKPRIAKKSTAKKN